MIAKLITNEIALQIIPELTSLFIFKSAKEEKVVNPPEKPAIQNNLCASVDFNLKMTSPANRTPS